MKPICASRDPGRYAVDYGHKVDIVACVDETGLSAQEVEAGIRRAEDDRRDAVARIPNPEQEDLPSEIFFG